MKKNISNDDCTRCANCGYIYESILKTCPNCNEPNNKGILEDLSYENNTEPVFNLND